MCGRGVSGRVGSGHQRARWPSARTNTLCAMSDPVTASYQATPEDVHRVLLLYSGGLDTSVMLKWIQDQYEAEVVALTVNLGQPGEDYDVVRGKAVALGAVDAFVIDAREEFAVGYIAPAIKANAIYGLGYPLFTALGPAVDRQARADRLRAPEALRHDRPRLHRQGQ